MKKTLYIICLIVLIVLTVGYGASYHALSARQHQAGQETLSEENGDAVREADLPDSPVVREGMYCLEETVNLNTGEITQKEQEIPEEWLGLDRVGLIRLLRECAVSPTGEDRTDGLCEYEVIAFSADALVVRRGIRPGSTGYFEYFMILEDGHVVVYNSDRKTVCMDTQITAQELRAEDVDSLTAGLYLESIWDVYHFLESYTS